MTNKFHRLFLELAFYLHLVQDLHPEKLWELYAVMCHVLLQSNQISEFLHLIYDTINVLYYLRYSLLKVLLCWTDSKRQSVVIIPSISCAKCCQQFSTLWQSFLMKSLCWHQVSSTWPLTIFMRYYFICAFQLYQVYLQNGWMTQ